MAGLLAAILLFEGDGIVHAPRPNIMRVRRRLLRDTSDPFSISENDFRQLYRFTKDACRFVINELLPHMPRTARRSAIPREFQILASLNFLASGSYQKRVGQDYVACMSQSSISRSLHFTVEALMKVMNKWINFPVSADRIQKIKEGFYLKGGFPGVIGAVDGTHVAIVPPVAEREHLFINRKLYHSLNVMVICDSELQILAANSAHGGRTHDSRVLRSSRIFAHLMGSQNAEESSSWLLGDSAYPLLPFLMTPKLNQVEGSPGARYTEHHNKTRVIVERCFGVLKGRWRCLRKERGLHYLPEFAALIINACCILHNMAIKLRIPDDEFLLDEMDMEPDEPNIVYEESGEQTRNRIINWYFQ